MRATVQILAAVVTIAILWSLAAFVRAQGDQFTEGAGFGFVLCLGILFAYRRFVGPID